MPIYRDTFLVKEGEPKLEIHIFDYMNKINPSEEGNNDSGTLKKQLICMPTCISNGTKNLTLMNETVKKSTLKDGQHFNGYFVRTKNGKYDYCYKIWTNRWLPFPPLNIPIPSEDEVNDVIVIDKNENYCGLACGPHLAFCKISTLEEVTGLSLADISYPFGGIKAILRKVTENRPSEIPYAAFEAIPVIPDLKKETNEDQKEVKIES